MASKRFGRFKQWASEAISSNKSVITEEAKEVEHDIELRREGLHRLYDTGALFHHNLTKKKHVDALEGEEKMLPREALGAVMILHGEQFENGAAYGKALVHLGQAHCKIATLQEAFALILGTAYLTSLSRSTDEIREYDAERKQLETRRINYDAALTAFEKVEVNKKAKEKDRREIEEELQKAKAKYDEAAEDLRARVASIQEREIDQLRELTNLLDVELRFAEQYADILRDVKDSWPSRSKEAPIRRPMGPMHTFSRSVDVDAANRPKPSHTPKPVSHNGSISSRPKSSAGHSSQHHSESESASESESESGSSLGEAPISSRSRASSIRSKTSRPPSRPASRPTSRAGRDRRDSTATIGNKSVKSVDEKSEKGSSSAAGKRKGVAGWAASWGRKKERDRDFATLDDSEHESMPSSVPSSRNMSVLSFRSKSANSPSIPARVPVVNHTTEGQKVVRALHDFAGSSDELSFRAGDRIIVTSEVLDDWWMGELGGRQGLFPTAYTEVLSSTSSLPLRAPPPLPLRGRDFDAGAEGLNAEAHPFGDHLAARGPYGVHSPMASTFSNDTDSIADSVLEETSLVPKRADDSNDLDGFGPPGAPVPQARLPLPRRDSAPRKAPPPPPPPRRSNTSTPAIPLTSLDTAPPIQHSLSEQVMRSPLTLPDSETGDCNSFMQNPFKAHGMCSNCFRMHNV